MNLLNCLKKNPKKRRRKQIKLTKNNRRRENKINYRGKDLNKQNDKGLGIMSTDKCSLRVNVNQDGIRDKGELFLLYIFFILKLI